MKTNLSSRTNSRRRGFTLTEIAIVLGIIGLILGAIWAAASAVYNNMRTSRATQELLQIAQAVRAMYSTQSTVDSGANMTVGTGAETGAAQTYLQAGIFPGDMLGCDAAATTCDSTVADSAKDPWGGEVAVSSASSPTAVDGALDSFVVTFDNVSEQGCVNMLTENTGTGRDTALWSVVAGALGAIPASATVIFPVPASTAEADCAANAGGSAIAFYFRLKG